MTFAESEDEEDDVMITSDNGGAFFENFYFDLL